MQPDVFFREITNDDLTLRRFHPQDASALCALRAEEGISEHGDWPLPFTLHDARALIEAQRDLHPNITGQRFVGAITKAHVRPLGSSLLLGEWSLITDHIDPRQVEFSFHLTQVYAKDPQKVAALLYTMCCYLFDRLHKNKIKVVVFPTQAQLADQLLGFGMTREAHFFENVCIRERWLDEYLFSLLASEWHGHYKGLHAHLARV